MATSVNIRIMGPIDAVHAIDDRTGALRGGRIVQIRPRFPAGELFGKDWEIVSARIDRDRRKRDSIARQLLRAGHLGSIRKRCSSGDRLNTLDHRVESVAPHRGQERRELELIEKLIDSERKNVVGLVA